MTHAGCRERGGQITIHAVAESDEDAGRQPSLRFGKDGRQGGGCGLPSSFDRVGRVGRRAFHGHRACRQRADRPDPLEIVPVGRVGSRMDGTLDRESVARDDLRIRGQRGRHAEGRRLAATRSQCGGLLAGSRRADRLHIERPRSTADRHVADHGRGRPERKSNQQQRGPDDDHDPGSSRDARRPPPRHEEAGTREHETGHAHRPADEGDRPGGGDRSDRQPAAARHVSEPSPAA